MEEKLRKNKFDLDDFLQQMEQVNKMGGIAKIINMIPGISEKDKKQLDFEKGAEQLNQMKAIIQSMTKAERKDPSILNASRRKRIAAGSGRSVAEVNTLVKQFNEMKKQLKMFNNPKAMKRNNLFRGLI